MARQVDIERHQDELEKRDEEERISDPMGWSAKLRVEHEVRFF